MNVRLLTLAGLCLVTGLTGCITTNDRSGDRAHESGFWQREYLALKRIGTSPVTVVSAAVAPYRVEGFSRSRATFLCPWMAIWGCGEMGEELAVGLTEALCGTQFRSCSYPMERFRFDVEDWCCRAESPQPEPVVSTEPAAVSDGPRTPGNLMLETRIAAAVAERNWTEAARLCRLRMAASVDEADRIGCGVRLALANWNAGDRVGAVIAMDVVVSLCANRGAAARREAEALRTRLRDGDAPRAFPAADILPDSGIAARIVGP